MVGLTRLELVTPAYQACVRKPTELQTRNFFFIRYIFEEQLVVDSTDRQSFVKEVIQPQVPLRLPCYDFTPVIGHTVVSVLLAVRLPTSGATNSHGVTGGCVQGPGTYSPRHSDPRLLAIPTSWSRVADSIRTTIGF